MPNVDIDSINDEDELLKLMHETQDFSERKKIRNRMKEVREKNEAEYKKKQAEIGPQEDAVKMRQRMAEQEKSRRLKDMDAIDKKAKEKQGIGEHERYIREKQKQAEEDRQKKIEGFKEMGKVMAQVYHAGTDVATKLDQQKAKELKEKHFGGTTQTSKMEKGADGSTVTTNVTTTRKTTKVTTSGTAGADKPGITPGGGGKVGIQRSPSAIKEMLLTWCRLCTKEYENVDIQNFSSSWNNGMAFCALIHHFRPVFDYKKLNPKCRRGNFKLAFDVAEKFADIAPLLDVDDMVKMKNPDWKCVFTYVQSFYRKFRDEEGAPKPKAASES